MNRNACVLTFLLATLAALAGCSGKPGPDQARNAKPLDKIEGKALLLVESSGATDAALNAGGPSVYLVHGERRYRLFLRAQADVVQGMDYVAEGVFAQKAIDDIGDPAQGKNGYPLEESCSRVVTMAWKDLAFDATDAQASLVRARVKRYPARPLFLVTRLRPANDAEISADKTEPQDLNIPEVAVPEEKERALLIEGQTSAPAPLWQPEGGTVLCKVLIGPEGKVAQLETGAQLCESVTWSQFRFQPTVRAGKPVRVNTEVKVQFEPRK